MPPPLRNAARALGSTIERTASSLIRGEVLMLSWIFSKTSEGKADTAEVTWAFSRKLIKIPKRERIDFLMAADILLVSIRQFSHHQIW